MARIKITELPVELNQKQMADSRGGVGNAPDFVDAILAAHMPARTTLDHGNSGGGGGGLSLDITR